jgi:hypothetical protein
VGKVIDALAHGPMPEQTIFDKRMVVECCETFHLHWRNLRLELSPENWVDFLATMERAAAAWQANGAPRSHVHLELARHWIQHPPVNTGELDVELCDNLYKVAPPPFGDGALLDDDDFVHFHIHDLRVEMSVAEFVQFAGILAAARDRLAARGADVVRLLELLDEHNVLYVVLRNWEALPHSVELGEHSDLDLLVHPLHVPVLDEVWRTTRTHDDPTRVQRRVPVADDGGHESFLLCDVRVPGDGYMPTAWSHELLCRRRRHEMFWVLSPRTTSSRFSTTSSITRASCAPTTPSGSSLSHRLQASTTRARRRATSAPRTASCEAMGSSAPSRTIAASSRTCPSSTRSRR